MALRMLFIATAFTTVGQGGFVPKSKEMQEQYNRGALVRNVVSMSEDKQCARSELAPAYSMPSNTCMYYDRWEEEDAKSKAEQERKLREFETRKTSWEERIKSHELVESLGAHGLEQLERMIAGRRFTHDQEVKKFKARRSTKEMMLQLEEKVRLLREEYVPYRPKHSKNDKNKHR